MARKYKVVVPRKTTGDSSWWTDARFGMFIHWGLYALGARHEWVKNREHIPDSVYQKYFDHFSPDLYDPREWARAAANAGMKYFVITTKHHEGFCLWDSKYTDYKATKTPCGKDLLRPMVDAFRAEGLRVGFYHSLIDWHHPEFPVDRIHPQWGDEKFKKREKGRDVSKYAKYLYKQTEELLTKFNPVDLLFFDFSYPGENGKGHEDWQSEKLIEMVRRLQPKILVNDRLDLPDLPEGWDFKTPEQFMSREWVKVNGKPVPWETCQTFSGSWGYHREETTWKSVPQLVQLLIDTVSKGGNLLLNVGPTSRGTFDGRTMERLEGIGDWMKLHSRSIYGCTQAPERFETPQDCRLTYSPETNRMYVHVFNWPIKELHLDGFARKVKYAQLVNDGSEVAYRDASKQIHGSLAERTRQGSVTLSLPVRKPDVAVPVVELFLG